MSLEGLSADTIVSRFSYQNDYRHERMVRPIISLDKLPKVSPLAAHLADTSNSPLGQLERLPMEVLHKVLYNSDLRSLARLSAASKQGHTTVWSLSAYHDLVQHAPGALAVLGVTGCICYHSLREVHAALCSENCSGCRYFGAFLFLPTCERCCFRCLSTNPSFWVTSPYLAGKCFGLDRDQVKKLQVMHTIPEHYQSRMTAMKQKTVVGVRAAKALGIRYNTLPAPTPSSEALGGQRMLTAAQRRERDYQQWIQKASVHVENEKDPVPISDLASVVIDKFAGMTSILFPSLQNGKPEPVLWCSGCRELPWRLPFMSPQEIEDTLQLHGINVHQSDDRVRDIFRALRNIAMSKSQFLTHVRHCHGIRRMLAKEQS